MSCIEYDISLTPDEHERFSRLIIGMLIDGHAGIDECLHAIFLAGLREFERRVGVIHA